MTHSISCIGVSSPQIEKAGQDGFVISLAPTFIFIWFLYLTNKYQEKTVCQAVC